MSIAWHVLLIALSKVHVINTLSQSPAIQFFSKFYVIWQPWTLDPDIFYEATVASDSLIGIIAFPVCVGLHVTFDNDGFNQRLWVVIVWPVAC